MTHIKTFFLFVLIALAAGYCFYTSPQINVTFEAETQNPIEFQIFYQPSAKKNFSEENSIKFFADTAKQISVDIPTHKIKRFRLDFGSNPGSIDIKNISLNGQNSVSFNNGSDFLYYNLERQKISDNSIRLFSDHADPFVVYQKPFEVKGVTTVNYYRLFAILLGAVFLFILYQNRGNLCKQFQKQLNKDWEQEITGYYKCIDPLYKKTFWITFIALNVVFLYHTVHFLWGNHDFGMVNYGLGWKDAFHQGRFTVFLMQQLFDGQAHPIINNIVYFAGLSTASVLLCRYWRLPHNIYAYLSISLLLVLLPYTLSWLYYTHMTIACGWLSAMIIFALVLADKICSLKSIFVKTIYFVSATFIIFYALSTYPVAINNIAIIFGGRILIDWLKSNTCLSCLTKIVHSHVCAFFTCLCGSVAYMLTFLAAKKYGIIIDAYNIQTASGRDIPQKIVNAFVESFKTLVYTYPFIDFILKAILLLVILTAVVSITAYGWQNFKKYKLLKTAAVWGTLVLLLFCTQLPLVISATPSLANGVRIQFFGLLYFYALCVALIYITGNQITRNFSLLFVSLAIIIGITRDYQAQKVWKFAFDNELRLHNRLLARIEEQNKFTQNHQYTYLQLGAFPSMAEQYYHKPYDMLASELLNFSYQPGWTPHVIINFLSEYKFINNVLWVDAIAENYNSAMDKELSDFIMNKARVWPQKDSVYVSDNYILVVANEAELNRVKERIKKDFLRKGR